MTDESARAWRFVPLLATALEGPLDGPAWDGDAILACRPEANEIVRIDPATGGVTRVRHSSCGTRGLAVGPDGRVYGAQARSRRVVWYNAGGGAFYLNAMLDGRRHNDPQDLVVDAGGRIWFTDDWTDASIPGPVGWPALDHRSVLRLTRIAETDDGIGEWHLERMTQDTLAPHGVGLGAGGRTLFVTDRGGPSVAADLRVYPIRGGILGVGRVLASFEPGDVPGGLAVDAGGRVVVAVGRVDRGPGALLVAEPDGRISGRHPMPGASLTNVLTGGDDGRTIYVTTSGGQLFRVDEAGPGRRQPADKPITETVD